MRRRRGFSLVELLIVLTIIVLLLGVAIPYALSIKMGAAETVVIREIQSIHQAQLQYSSQYGHYAATLAELGPGNVEGKRTPGLIPASLTSGEKDGYIFSMTATAEGYTIHANPKVFNSTGHRTFYLDQTGIVHQNWGSAPAEENSPELK